MTRKLLNQALQEIAEDSSLTAQEKLRRQAAVNRDFRSIKGKATVGFSRRDKTSIWGTFFRSAARSAGRSFIKSLCK